MTLEEKLKDAGLLGLPFSWDGNGGLRFGADITAEQRTTIEAIFAPPAFELDALKGEKLTEVNIACRDAIYAGFDCDALGVVHHYPALDRDQSNLAGSILDSLLPGVPADWTTPFWCADSAGVWALRPHTAAQIQQVGRVAKAAVIAAIERCAGLEEQIAAATTEAELAAIAW